MAGSGMEPHRPAKALVCRWCPSLATGLMTGTGGKLGAQKVPYCDAEQCWQETYRVAVKCPTRKWIGVEQPEGLF